MAYIYKILYFSKNCERTYNLTPGEDITIGRLEDNAIAFLNNESISRHHCSIYFHPDRKSFILKDLNSTNGIILNGNKLSSDVILTNKDKIKLGDVTLSYYCVKEQESDSKVAKPIRTFGLDPFNSMLQTQSFLKNNELETRVQFSKPKKFKLTQGDKVGDFIINEKLKESSFSTLFSANRKDNGKSVALKIYHKNLNSEPQLQDIFIDTLVRISSLKSNSFVSYFESGLHNGYCFYTMELHDLGNLEDDIAISAPMDEIESLKHSLNIAKILNEALINHDLIHRDLKASNVFFDIDYNITLAGMGLSNWESIAIAGGYSAASTWYISPEQIMGENIRWHSDLYSLGIILFQMLTGEFPFNSRVEDELLEMHLKAHLPKPTDRKPNIKISKETLKLLNKMTQKDPSKRYRSWDDFINNISSVIESLSNVSQKRKRNSF